MGTRVAVIGYGSMGKMLVEKIVAPGVVAARDVFVANRTFEKITELSDTLGVSACRSNHEAAEHADVVFACLRPADMKDALVEILPVLGGKHLVSLNGSIRFSQLEKACGTIRITKAIPSVTAEVNASQTLVCHNAQVGAEDKARLHKILRSFGSVIELPEDEMGMGAELVSCMPGFMAALLGELQKAAAKHSGLSEQQMTEMLALTMTGTGRLIAEKRMTFSEVIERVATKGGITREGTDVIEERFPPVAEGIFERTLEKRRLTTERAAKAFGSGGS